MDALGIIYLFTSAIDAGLVIWCYTPSGKKWLKNL